MWLTLYTPTNLAASSNMLFRREMTMNCAFFVRSLMYAATMETWKYRQHCTLFSLISIEGHLRSGNPTQHQSHP